jgi:hypothetical protein
MFSALYYTLCSILSYIYSTLRFYASALYYNLCSILLIYIFLHLYLCFQSFIFYNLCSIPPHTHTRHPMPKSTTYAHPYHTYSKTCILCFLPILGPPLCFYLTIYSHIPGLMLSALIFILLCFYLYHTLYTCILCFQFIIVLMFYLLYIASINLYLCSLFILYFMFILLYIFLHL